MTAVYNAIRQLDALLDRGDISPEEYARRRQTLLANIEEAEATIDVIDITPASNPATVLSEPADDASAERGSSAFGLGLVIVFGVMGLCIASTLLFLPNFNLALTLGVTILAAICVALFCAAED